MFACAASPTTSFENLLSAALVAGLRDGRDFALDFGINETALVRYTDGAVCDAEERRHIEHVLGRNQWSREFVIKRVRKKMIRSRSAA